MNSPILKSSILFAFAQALAPSHTGGEQVKKLHEMQLKADGIEYYTDAEADSAP